MNKKLIYGLSILSVLGAMASCSDNDSEGKGGDDPSSHEAELLKGLDIKTIPTINDEEYYTGGKLGTTFDESAYSYRQPTQAVEDASMSLEFQNGEQFFEKDFTETGSLFGGLGPVAVRSGCLYCHPAYGHGKRTTKINAGQYRANDMGNGYLLVIYDKKTNAYIRSVAGMPQTIGYGPFKAPVDESKIKIEWKNYTDEWGNKFDDGETYSLQYPDVTITPDAFYAPVVVARNGQNVTLTDDEVKSDIGVLLEVTIGIYGTGMTDAIPEDSITAQYIAESKYFNSIGRTDALNSSYWNQSTMTWTKPDGSDSRYSGLTGTKYVRRWTYALTRGPVLDGPGANAIWNITNVTRPDRRYHYLDLNYSKGKPETSYYAQTAAKDSEVQAGFFDYLANIDPNKNHVEWWTENMEQNILNFLCSTTLEPEMTQDEYKNLMIWHRGLAVPAARDLDDEDVRMGHYLFRQIGCANCHRPSWKTGEDHIQDPNGLFGDSDMPRYPNQTIWPYTDFVQHKLHMVNDIRTGWCRTTPLWGRGLSKINTNSEERLHDLRARNTLEAIMWHGNANSDARASIENFRKLNKAQRAAIIAFCDAI